jgi:NDP-sugar pyrophosphorylase family protein
VSDGYWIDIGTPAKYMQVHRDIMDGRYKAPPFADAPPSTAWVGADVKMDEGVELHGPCFVDEGVVLKAGARVLPYSVVGRQTHVSEGAVIDGSIVWPNGWIGPEAVVRSSLLGRNCHIGRNVTIETPVQLGDKTAITDYSHL